MLKQSSEDFNIVDLFLRYAATERDTPAIIFKGQQISFGELEQKVRATATHFRNKGLKPGDRVLVFVPMSIDLYRIVLAIYYLGATAVFLDEWVSKSRMEECCRIARCNAFVSGWKIRLLSFFSPELRKIPIRFNLRGVPEFKNIQARHSTGVGDTALITFTTGTTGTPKAAKRTHGFLREQFDALIEKINPREGEVDMPALPIVLMINLGVGCTSVIPEFKAGKPYKLNAEKILQQIRRCKVERIVASPFFVERISKYVLQHNIDTPSIKKIFTGGAPVFPAEAEIYLKAFSQAKIEIVYGSTEAEPISSIAAAGLLNQKNNFLQKGLAVGKPYRKANVRIIKLIKGVIQCASVAEIDSITLADGNIGEITVSGPHVLREYFNNEAALFQNKIFIGEDCWHRTGDSGYLENGHLYLTGRVDTLIYKNGNIISPFVYQSILQSLDGVKIGTVMEIAGKVLIIAEPRKNIKHEEIKEKIRHLNVACDEIRFIKKMPRDKRHHSRIDYGVLREMLKQ